MAEKRMFTVRIKKDKSTGWYAARCVELPEAISQGKAVEEALNNIREAIELVLEDHGEVAKKQGGKLIEIFV